MRIWAISVGRRIYWLTTYSFFTQDFTTWRKLCIWSCTNIWMLSKSTWWLLCSLPIFSYWLTSNWFVISNDNDANWIKNDNNESWQEFKFWESSILFAYFSRLLANFIQGSKTIDLRYRRFPTRLPLLILPHERYNATCCYFSSFILESPLAF